MTDTPHSSPSGVTVGLAYMSAAFLVWGLGPIFWKALREISAAEILAHRITWCALLMLGVLTLQKRWTHLPRLLRPATVATLIGTTALIGVNWYIYIWAINSNRVLETSLGYFINPLLSVVLGMVFLGEKLSRWQALSVALAGVGVLVLTWRAGHLPWVSLVLALTFGFYGLLRKKVEASPEEGLAVETGILIPIALVYLISLERSGEGAFGHAGLGTHVLLLLTGAITAGPMVWFTHGARRLPLSTIGIMQYVAPTLQFLLAVLVYREPFEAPQLVAFLFIWTALVIFTIDARLTWKRSRGQRSRDQVRRAAGEVGAPS